MRRDRFLTPVLAVFVVANTWHGTATAGERPTCFGEPATIVMKGDQWSVAGTEGDDVIVGTNGADYIDGRGGDDLICALANNVASGSDDEEDTVEGGEGNDTIDGGRFSDFIDGGPGADRVFGGRGYDYIDGEEGADSVSGEKGNDYIDGGDGDDVLGGGVDNDKILGGPEEDTLTGGKGFDLVAYNEQCCDYSYDAGSVELDLARGVATAEDGRDSISGFEWVRGTNGNDLIQGDSGANTIDGMLGDDEVFGRNGDDQLSGNERYPFHGQEDQAGDDTLDGGNGSDTIDFTETGGDTRLEVDLSAGTATGRGSDTLVSIENVIGGWGSDSITGNELANHVTPGLYDEGDDTIRGLGGDDVLEGGPGTDSLDGGDGRDTCLDGEIYESCESGAIGRRLSSK